MARWPDKDESLSLRYVQRLGYKQPSAFRCWIRQFQHFVIQHSARQGLTGPVFHAWIRYRAKQTTEKPVIRQATFIKNFLDWLVQQNVIDGHPLQQLQKKYQCCSTRPIIRALMGPKPNAALASLRPLPRYGSHLGDVIRQHIQRMQTLGYRYAHERMFLCFDRFLQQRPGASQTPLLMLVREYVNAASSPNAKLRRLIVCRLVVRALNRQGMSVAIPDIDRSLLRLELHRRRRPYIYTREEVERILQTAQCYPSRHAPLRPLTLYTILALAYSAGLRLGEIVRLRLKDLDLTNGCIEVHETKFFKSRRLPLSQTAITALSDYLKARRKSAPSSVPDAFVFCHHRGGYSRHTAGHLLHDVVRRAGIQTKDGRTPRIHDLRHTFTVHRLTSWYQDDNIQPESRLPYLASYLGHRDINSTLVYLTMTDELLERASQRFRTAEPQIVENLRRGTQRC